jgi:hypothetical protein
MPSQKNIGQAKLDTFSALPANIIEAKPEPICKPRHHLQSLVISHLPSQARNHLLSQARNHQEIILVIKCVLTFNLVFPYHVKKS